MIKAIEDALSGRFERGVWRVQKIARWVRRNVLRDASVQQ